LNARDRVVFQQQRMHQFDGVDARRSELSEDLLDHRRGSYFG